MRFRYIAAVALLIGSPVVLVDCSGQERKDAAQDWASYVGATPHPDGSLEKDAAGNPVFDNKPDYDPKEVAEKTAIEAAKRVGNPTDLAIWAAVGGLTLGVAWFKRRFLATTAKAAVKATARAIVGKTDPLDEKKEEDL